MIKEKKTSKASFKLFQAECYRMQTELGLVRYDIYFEMVDLGRDSEGDRLLANIDISEMGKCATIRLASTYNSKHPQDVNPIILAKHEMFHLLIHKLAWLGQSRHIGNTDITEEEESITCTLENFMKNYKRRSQSNG